MKEFHDFTCLADKDVDLSIGRIATGLSNLTAHCVDPNSHISWGIGEEKLVILVEIKHKAVNFRQRSEIYSL